MWKYTGDGAFLPGVPARDISEEEARERGIEEKLKASRIYRRAAERVDDKSKGGED